MRFRHRTSPITLTLYPMVRIGEQAYYNGVFREAFDHDVALVEGLKSPVMRHLRRQYSWINLKKLGLVLQPEIPSQDEVYAKIVYADLTAEEFRIEWRKVSAPFRIILYVLSPLIGFHRRLFSSRSSLAKNKSLRDLPSSNEVLHWNPKFEPIRHSALHARDKRLLECLACELNGNAEKRIAIVFGARHMRAVISDLRKRGFVSSDATWQTVFTL